MESSIWKFVQQFFRVTHSFMTSFTQTCIPDSNSLCLKLPKPLLLCKSSFWVILFYHKAKIHQFSICFFLSGTFRVSKVNINHRCSWLLVSSPFLITFLIQLWVLFGLVTLQMFLLFLNKISNQGETVSFVKCDFVQWDNNVCYSVCFHCD